MEQQEDDMVSIDFKAFFSILKKERIIIALITLLFAIVGGIYAFTAKPEFTSEGKILPELSSKASKLGGLSSLASLAGVDLGGAAGGADAIRPDLYPDVVQSTPFYLHLLKQKVKTKEGTTLTFENFYKGKKEKSWFSSLFESDSTKVSGLKIVTPQDSNVIMLSQKQANYILKLEKEIVAAYDKKTGVITITSKMSDPVVAAMVTELTMKYITEYVTDYRTEKSRRDLVFLQRRLNEAKGRYYGEQSRKAQYSDQTKYIALQTADLQRERIESDYKVSSTVYNGLLSQLEQAKIKVQEETPVFQVLQPPVIPLKKSAPKKLNIIIIYSFIGGILGVLYAVFRKGNYKSIIS